MVLIYIYGCVCGPKSRYVTKVKRWAKERHISVELRNSRYDKIYRDEHANYLSELDLSDDAYDPIVINDGKVMRLLEWNL